ncbi:T9SS type A sorting domain-containing protein [Flavobacterium inviolabile]|uniref:T9SS type A sorting domain-containing protein n=1 Tax=Flavobacterium inviolabile TaxID=2748320 RepID=UPI0015AE1452|nr:T9SS type A sorting domain-containing protein [Flavobacterium inviolabile]
MKKLYILSLALFTSAASFAQFVYEPFNFTGVAATATNGWTTHGGTTGQITTTSGSLSYTGLLASTGNRVSIVAGNNEDINKATTSAITGAAYYSTIIRVQNTTSLHLNSAAGDYFFSATSVASATTTAFQGRLYIRQGSAANTVNLGVLNNSGGTAAPTFAATDYPVNTSLFIVIKYDIASNTASLWVNPVPGAAEPAATVTNATGTTAAPTNINGLVIRQGGNATNGTGNVELDEMRIGTTWAQVTPQATASLTDNAIAGLKVYPNPVSGNNFYISSDATAVKSVAVYDVLGKQVINTKVENEAAINVSNLNAGVYIVKITEEGKTATRKLVIK